jgi:exopolysaccharide biosynthesis predicted pyruvyltransferase EpsI
MSYSNYAEKYLLSDVEGNLEDLAYDTSLYSISDYLKEAKNYKIYESIDDYLINKSQLEYLKNYAPENVICLNNGSHLGFLYRKEFQDELKKDIVIN